MTRNSHNLLWNNVTFLFATFFLCLECWPNNKENVVNAALSLSRMSLLQKKKTQILKQLFGLLIFEPASVLSWDHLDLAIRVGWRAYLTSLVEWINHSQTISFIHSAFFCKPGSISTKTRQESGWIPSKSRISSIRQVT